MLGGVCYVDMATYDGRTLCGVTVGPSSKIAVFMSAATCPYCCESIQKMLDRLRPRPSDGDARGT